MLGISSSPNTTTSSPSSALLEIPGGVDTGVDAQTSTSNENDECQIISSAKALSAYLRVYVRQNFCYAWFVPHSCLRGAGRNTPESWKKRANGLDASVDTAWKKMYLYLNGFQDQAGEDPMVLDEKARLPHLRLVFHKLCASSAQCAQFVEPIVQCVAECIDEIRDMYLQLAKIKDHKKRSTCNHETISGQVEKCLQTCEGVLRTMQWDVAKQPDSFSKPPQPDSQTKSPQRDYTRPPDKHE
mmetsp:Transcript_4349/g.6847  ORF Transcript_4349/g.6847 Transcript_4349/m.6847 type:complete len:242 (-) Transcript_4349:444-1169(-)